MLCKALQEYTYLHLHPSPVAIILFCAPTGAAKTCGGPHYGQGLHTTVAHFCSDEKRLMVWWTSLWSGCLDRWAASREESVRSPTEVLWRGAEVALQQIGARGLGDPSRWHPLALSSFSIGWLFLEINSPTLSKHDRIPSLYGCGRLQGGLEPSSVGSLESFLFPE